MDFEQSFLNHSGAFSNVNRNDSALYTSQFINADQTERFSEICQSIFVDYHANSLSGNSFEDIITSFIETAANGVQIFQRTFDTRRTCDGRIEAFFRSLETERNIFDLILKLYHGEIISQSDDDESSSLLKQLFVKNKEFRRLATLLHWSEESAFQNPLGFSQIIAEVEHIRKIDHAFAQSALNKKFAHLDSIYIDHQLSPEDSNNLKRIKQLFFCLLRCGRYSKLKELVEETGLSSLKTFLQVRQLLTDPCQTPLDDKSENYEFVESRLHFKTTASLLLSLPDESISEVDRSIWATLSGNLATLLTYAENSDDILWSYINCAIEAILDNEIVKTHNIDDDDLIEKLNGAEKIPQTVTAVFSGFSSHCDDAYFKIVGHLVANNFEEVVNLAYSTVNNDDADLNKLRLYAHIVLLIKKRNSGYDKVKANQIILRYSKMLITLEMYALVPFYLSKLDEKQSINEMVNFLYGINGESMRHEILKAAAEVKFDVGKLCIKVYEKAKLENPLDDAQKLSDSIAQLLYIWKFLLISQDTACEALVECNNLLRELFERDRYAEAMELLGQSPQNLTVETDEFIQKLPTEKRDEKMIRRIQDQQREFNSYLLYLEIMEKFSVWQHRVNEEFSERPQKLSDVEYAKMDAVQKAEYERQMNQAMTKMQAHLKGCEKYQSVVVNQILDLLYQAPTFFASCLDLKDVENVEAHQKRKSQLDRIHERYLYYTITMLITLKSRREALDVANLLMDSRYDLYVHLSKESLRKLIAEISKSGYVLALNDEEEE